MIPVELPPCETCGLRELCSISQSENYRLGALIYPFARAVCEPRCGGRPPDPKRLALFEQIVDCLAAAGAPLTARQIAERLSTAEGAGQLTGSGDRLRNALYALACAGRVIVVGKTPGGEGRRQNLYTAG